MPQKKSLGRGLGAILPDLLKDFNNDSPFMMAGVEDVFPNRFQPRQNFNAEELHKLVVSIQKNGLIQPIVVRKTDQGYEIIAGERRWRAAQAAGLHEVPIVIRTADDLEIAELSLIENILRESLDPLEEAQAYQTLTENFSLSQEALAERVGKDRSTIANSLRLLRLPEPIKRALVDKTITAGHARSLLALDSSADQVETLRTILKKGLSVRQTEAVIAQKSKKTKAKEPRDLQLDHLEQELSRLLLTKVKIKKKLHSGNIEIGFTNNLELKRLISLLLSVADG